MGNLIKIRVIGRLCHLLFPGTSWCYRCLMPWTIVRGHSTEYKEGCGCFPLCTLCWATLSKEERIPFYELLISEWEKDKYVSFREGNLIRQAVLEGK